MDMRREVAMAMAMAAEGEGGRGATNTLGSLHRRERCTCHPSLLNDRRTMIRRAAVEGTGAKVDEAAAAAAAAIKAGRHVRRPSAMAMVKARATATAKAKETALAANT